MAKRIIWIVLPLLILGGLVGWRLQQRGGEEAKLKAGPGGPGGSRTPTVAVTEAAPALILERLQAVGTLESPVQSRLSPRTGGRILSVGVREGDVVQAGQVLARIDPAEAEAALLQAQATLAQARARLAEAQFGQGPNAAGVRGTQLTASANLRSAEAELTRVRRSGDAEVAAVAAQVTNADAQVRSARAAVAEAEAAVRREQANLTNLQTRAKRLQSLLDEGFVSQQEVENAQTAVATGQATVEAVREGVRSAQAGVASANATRTAAAQNLNVARRKVTADVAAAAAARDAARAQLGVARANQAQNPAYAENLSALRAAVAVAEAGVRAAEVRRGDTILRSPVAGTVTERAADPGAQAAPGTPVLTVQFLDWLYCNASLPVEQGGLIRAGSPVTMTFDAVEGQFQGRVERINPAADPTSRQLGFRVRLENGDRRLRPGMFGRLSIVVRQTRAAVAVPREAVTEGREGTTVNVVNAQDEIETRKVELGQRDPSKVQVLSGLQPGDRVITLAYGRLRDGQKVRVGDPKAEDSGPEKGSPRERGKQE